MTDMYREGFELEFGIQPSEKIEDFYNKDYLIQWWHVWQAAMRYRDEHDQTSVWRCYKEYASGDGGICHSEKFAKTKADMLIFKSQGYDCEKLSDEQEKQA